MLGWGGKPCDITRVTYVLTTGLWLCPAREPEKRHWEVSVQTWGILKEQVHLLLIDKAFFENSTLFSIDSRQSTFKLDFILRLHLKVLLLIIWINIFFSFYSTLSWKVKEWSHSLWNIKWNIIVLWLLSYIVLASIYSNVEISEIWLW